MSGLLTAAEAAALLSVPKSWVLAEARANRIPHAADRSGAAAPEPAEHRDLRARGSRPLRLLAAPWPQGGAER